MEIFMAEYHKCSNFDWDEIPVLKYKEDGTHFKDIIRKTFFEGSSGLGAEFRYFEIASGGHSTLEYHDHIHLVMIIRGSGRALVGDKIFECRPFDFIQIEPQTWHQFQANENEPFGFLCIVNTDRDRPHRPDELELEVLRSEPEVAAFIKV
jgi:quercetin dioxygenase-like cupin family protein